MSVSARKIFQSFFHRFLVCFIKNDPELFTVDVVYLRKQSPRTNISKQVNNSKHPKQKSILSYNQQYVWAKQQKHTV